MVFLVVDIYLLRQEVFTLVYPLLVRSSGGSRQVGPRTVESRWGGHWTINLTESNRNNSMQLVGVYPPTSVPTHSPTHSPVYPPTNQPTHQCTHPPVYQPTHQCTHSPSLFSFFTLAVTLSSLLQNKYMNSEILHRYMFFSVADSFHEF